MHEDFAQFLMEKRGMSRQTAERLAAARYTDFTDDEFARVLEWAHEGLLTSPTSSPADLELFKRLEHMTR